MHNAGRGRSMDKAVTAHVDAGVLILALYLEKYQITSAQVV